jgi:lipopolysaccharide export system permease protein
MIEEIKRQVASDRESRTEVRLIGAGSRFYVAHYYDARTSTLRSVSVQFLQRPTLRGRVDAETAQYQDGIWDFKNGFWRAFRDSTETTLRFRHFADSRMDELPGDFARTNEDPFYMNMKTLLTFARRVRESGGDTQKHMTNFHIRASFPLANLIMVLLGTALSLRVARGGNLAMGVGISLSIGFAYFTFIRVGQALGYNGTLPPLLAAWLANLVFGGFGGLLFWKVTR